MAWGDFSFHRQACLSLTSPFSANTPSTGGITERCVQVAGFHDESFSVDNGSIIAGTPTTLGEGTH